MNDFQLTPEKLLDLKLDGNSTLRDVFLSHLLEDQFSVHGTELDDEEQEAFFASMAQKLIDAVKLDVAQVAYGSFGGDACDFGEWLEEQVKGHP